ncbi:uncharacterized protein LOC110681723 isoform X1 [Chenopodium quinoa]|uniref:uncharacterized protein LOC110681723 isoform X1 n=1 Tax=Chenopodium quinoa TaxID=63459 RepID=UPI000B7906AF|nr:uncharacterized protein LOC110681723 isoform X1 [Chenopodium quinoa]
MNHAIKLGRLSSQTLILSSSSGLSSVTSRKGVGSVRLVQVSIGKDPKSDFRNMDKNTKNPDQEDKDVTCLHVLPYNRNAMEESFGQGYSTRSNDEGFGGIYGGNDEFADEAGNAEMKITQNPGFHDSNQGSKLKEKEKARNQTQAK